MKALRLDNASTLSYVEVPVPELGDDEVLVRVRACGICGSDVHGFDGSSGRRTPPLVMGHEAAGVVVQVGAGAREWREGARVTFDSTLSCGTCPACLTGRSNLCQRRQVVGASFPGYRRDGAFAELVAVPWSALVRLPEGLSFEEAALAEPLAVALHAVSLAGKLDSAVVAVIGSGVIGLLAVQAARAAAAGCVIAVDLEATRLDVARRLGAQITLLADRDDVGQAVAEATGGRGADVVIEAVGVSAAIRTSVACVRRGGRIVLVGNVTPTVELPLQEIVTGELTLVGSCASSGELVSSVELLASGAVDVEPLISVVAPLAEGQIWFDRLHKRESGLLKVILTPPGEAS